MGGWGGYVIIAVEEGAVLMVEGCSICANGVGRCAGTSGIITVEEGAVMKVEGVKMRAKRVERHTVDILRKIDRKE